MSSTSRGGERIADDFYATPAWCTDALLRRIGPLTGKRILEPSSGDGAIVRRLLLAGADPVHVLGIEIDDGRATTTEASGIDVWRSTFERWAAGETPYGFPDFFDLVVMNPPFSLAQHHVELAISLLAPGGLCCALLRVAFACSKKRASFRAAHPFDLLVLASRPSFTGAGSDSADYAWFLFGTRGIASTISEPRSTGGRFEIVEGGKR